MSDVNLTEFKGAVDGFKQTLAEALEIGKNTSDEVKNIQQSSSETKEAHDKAIAELDKKMADVEKFIVRKSNVKDEDGLAPENVKRFDYTTKNLGTMKRVLDDSEKTEVKYLYDMIMTKGARYCDGLFTPEQKALVNTIISTEGGYLTAPEYDQEIINKEFELQGVMGLVNVRNSSTGTLHQTIDYANYDSWEYVNELANGNPNDHEPNYRDVSWNVTEQLYNFSISRSELEDAEINVETDIIGKAREGAIRQTSAQVLVGDGVNRPKGILSYEDGTDYNKIQRVESEETQVLKWEDVITRLPGALIGPYHNNAKYAMNRQSFFNLLSDKDGAEQFSIMNQINFFSGAGAGMFIMGKEVVFDSFLQDASTAGNQAVIFGDFDKAYRVVQRVGFSLIMDDVTNGQRVNYILRRRNDGRLRMGDALKVLKIKA